MKLDISMKDGWKFDSTENLLIYIKVLTLLTLHLLLLGNLLRSRDLIFWQF